MTLASIKSTRVARGCRRSPASPPPTSISDLGNGRAFCVREHMAAAIAGGDEAKMASLHEICGRYKDAEEMHQASHQVVKEASEEEQSWISWKAPLEILYWAMMEAESNDPERRARWYRNASYDWVSSHPVWDDVQGVTMTMGSPPRYPTMSVVTGDDVRVLPRQNVVWVVSQLSRRSPRFPSVLRGSRRLHRAPPMSRRLPGSQSIMDAAEEESRTPTIVLLLHFPIKGGTSKGVDARSKNHGVGGR
ncbi:hypothetical protein CFC21_068278 [Triticum aestivum]|uniref:Uncharacterized protein n=2 Tax=Triticum aestivum TaxID=4565 RepID=A0A3B6KNZ2_WHEAT|nr:hypothetical protein CFC21_068278 [Triticum aestivum]